VVAFLGYLAASTMVALARTGLIGSTADAMQGER
jgi:hypothetical protein